MSQPSQGPIFTHGGWDVYAALLFIAIPVALAALLHRATTYSNAGLRKKPWAIAAAVCTITFTGPFFAVFYLVKVRPKFKALRPRRRTTEWTRGGGGGSREPYQGNSGRFEGVKRQTCAGCHGAKVENCYQCSGGLVSDGSGGMVRHNVCGGTGKLTCRTCNGSGYAN
ncbi:MAG TPA: hypothetical protein VFP34_16715 [Microlunatus sp.]|nr:hypothetical protein [Microlunatus sp.]